MVTGQLGAVDPDSPKLTYKVIQQPAHGTVTINADGTYTYTPTSAPSHLGSADSFTVKVSDAASGFTIHGLPGLIHLLTFGLLGSAGDSSRKVVTVTNTTPYSIDSADHTSGIVTGHLNVADPNTNPLSFGLDTASFNTGFGAVAVNPATGGWIYTPSTVALTQAYAHGGATTTFTIDATNTATGASTAVTVTTPVSVATASLMSMLQRTGSTPSAIAVGPAGTVYVTNSGANTLSIIDSTSITVTVGKKPGAVAVGTNGQVWVANSGDNTVTITSPTGTVLYTVTVGEAPSAITFGADGTAYVANANSNTVSVINATTCAVINTVAVGKTPTGIGAGPDGRIYTADYAGGSVTIIDPADNYATDTITLPDINPWGITVSRTGMIVVTDPLKDTVTELAAVPTPSTMAVTAVRDVSAGAATSTTGTDTTDPTSLVASSNGASYSVDSVAVAGNPTAITSDSAGTLYVTNISAGTVTVINPTTGALSTLHVGASPVGIAAGPNATINTVSSTDNTVTVTNTQTGAAATTPVGVNPYTVTADAHGNLTITNNYDNTASMINRSNPGTGSTGTAITGTVKTGTLTTGTALPGILTTGTVTNWTVTATGATILAGDGTSDPVLSPDGRYAYVTSNSSTAGGSVWIINPATGTATDIHIGTSVDTYVTVAPDSQYAYITDSADGTVSLINPTTGTATTFHTGKVTSQSLTISPDSRYAYAASGAGTVTIINPATGTATIINAGDVAPQDIPFVTVSSDGRYAYVTRFNSISVINPATRTAATFYSADGQRFSPTISPTGNYTYFTNPNGTTSVINPATGMATIFPTGTGPYARQWMVVSPDGRYAYVSYVNTHNDDGSLTVIDATTGTATVLHVFPYATQPTVVSPDSRYAYVRNADGTVTIVNSATGAASTVNIGTDVSRSDYEDQVVATPDSRYAYVGAAEFNGSDYYNATVTIINPATGTATTIPTGGGFDVFVSPDSRHAYTFNTDGTLKTINPATGTSYDGDGDGNGIALIAYSDGTTAAISTNGAFAQVTPDSRYAYVTHSDGTVTIINVASGSATTGDTGIPSDLGLSITSDSRYAYAAGGHYGTVAVINPATGTVTTIPVGGSLYTGPVVGSYNDYAFVSDYDGGTVSVINPTMGTATAIATGGGPREIVVSPDGRYAYVTSGGNGTVTVIDTTKVTFSPKAIAPNNSASTFANTSVLLDPTSTTVITNSSVTITGISAPANGTAVLHNSLITYTPNAGYTGTDTFTYTATNGITTGTGTITVHVTTPPPTVPAAPAGYTYAHSPTTVRSLFERLWATTNHVGDGMHIDTVYGDDGDVRYVVYFGGTGFTSKLSPLRNADFFTSSTPYVDREWLQKIEGTVQSPNSQIMLVGFSQGGMDAQNIGAALSSSGYDVSDVITLASPVITRPTTAYTTLNFTPSGDAVGDGLLVGPPGDGLGVPLSASYKQMAITQGSEYEQWVGFEGWPQHGNLATYLTLADKFDHSTFYDSTKSSIVGNQVQQDIQTFSGQVLVHDDQEVRIDDGTPGGTLVPGS